MKFFVLLLLSLSSSSYASILLQYYCANSVYSSELTIDDRGKVVVNEACFDWCAEHSYSRTYQLSQPQLLQLKSAIDTIEARTIDTQNEPGCNAGIFVVYRGKEEIVVRTVNSLKATLNPSIIARNLEALAQQYVKEKIVKEK